MKSFWFGISALLLTSAFFTQLLQDRALWPLLAHGDWKHQFAAEILLALAALAAGVFSGHGNSSKDFKGRE